jgi:hypothetical protein
MAEPPACGMFGEQRLNRLQASAKPMLDPGEPLVITALQYVREIMPDAWHDQRVRVGLSRDTTDLLIIARDMQRAGAGIRSLAEPFLDTTSDFAEIIFAILVVAAKLERRRILERTARGRADAKANGVKFGRKPTLTPHQQQEARKRLEAGETQRSVARSYNVSQSTISRLS